MSTLSIRLPDDVTDRLKALAQSRKISLNKLMFELSTRILVEEDSKKLFEVAQLRGNRTRCLQMLDELDALNVREQS